MRNVGLRKDPPGVRRPVRAAVPALLLAVTGCGLPGDTNVRAVDEDSVPYRLLDGDRPSGPRASEPPVSELTPVVFWVVDGDRLAPSAVPFSCAGPSSAVAERLLAVLGAGPNEAARDGGRSSAVPPSSELDLVEVEDGVATVALDPATPISVELLPLAVGQLVLSITSAPDVDEVLVSIAGDAVQVPLPGGALTPAPVSADDYAVLLPERYRGRGKPATVANALGCRSSEGSRR